MANKLLGIALPKGSQEKAAIVAAVAGVILVVVALRGRSSSSAPAAAAGTAPAVGSGDVLAAVSTGASAASNGLAFGAQVAGGGLALAQSVTSVLGSVTTQLGDSLSRVALGQQDLIGKLATPKVQTIVYQPSPFVDNGKPKTVDTTSIVTKPALSAQDQRIAALQAVGYTREAATIDATTSAEKPYLLDNSFAITKDTADFLKKFGAKVTAAA